MTEETNKKPPKITWNDKEYDQEELTAIQKYLFAQLLDVQKKEQQAQFAMDQILAMKATFEERLKKELVDS